MSLAYQCLRLALASDNNHAEAYNNLGVLEMRKRRPDQVEQVFLCIILYVRGPTLPTAVCVLIGKINSGRNLV